MALNPEDISPKRCIQYANELIELCDLSFPRISSIPDINSSFFISLFEHITGITVPDLLLSNDSTTEAHNIQAVIDTISLDLFGVSLSHITGEDIVSGNVISIINLLEVLEAMFVHLLPEIKDIGKESRDALVAEKNSKRSSSTDEHINETFTIIKTPTEDEENILPTRIIKRKTCKNTLRKSHERIPKKKTDQAVPVPSHSKRSLDTPSKLKPQLKRKNSKPVETIYKRPNVKGIEDLLESNFEMKLRTLLHSEKSPMKDLHLRAQELRSKYIQSLRKPLKKTVVPYCNKSFLLPHDLRPRAKSSIQHRARKKTSPKRQRVKADLLENAKSSEQDSETPAAIQSMLKEFPGFQFSTNTLELMKKYYYQNVSSMHKQLKDALLKKPTVVKQAEKAMEKEAKLSNILAKDLQEKDYLRKVNEHKALQNRIKASLRDARMQSVKMRQYFEEFHKSMSKKLGKRNFSEEVLIEKTFKEMLDLQKEKIRLLCKRMKEADEDDAVQHRRYLSSLKNVYEEQLGLLAESVNAKQKQLFESEKAKKQATDKMNQEILKSLQQEVRSLQKDVLEMLQDIQFRELDAQNFIDNCRLQDL